MAILLYFFLFITSVLLYMLRKDAFILNQYYSVVFIPIVFSVGWFVSSVSVENEGLNKLFMLALLTPFLILFILGRRRLAREGNLTCEICGEKLKTVKDHHSSIMINNRIEPCKNCS